MALYELFLETKTSQIPNAGLGLFTTVAIKKGDRIIEYTGKITTWAEADHMNGDNPFIFYVNENHVIDASKTRKSLAKYANDAKGLTKVKGLTNNAEFEEDGLKVYIIATKNIKPNQEIFVDYGPDYWKTVKENMKIDNLIAKAKKKK
jgi:SET domain-containing protein